MYSKETELKAVSGRCIVSVSVYSDCPLNLDKRSKRDTTVECLNVVSENNLGKVS